MEAHIQSPLKSLLVDVTKLQEDSQNARLHDEKNLETIKESLKRFGQTKPIVLSKDGKTILAGNGTFKAALSLGWEEIAAVKSNLSKEDGRAYAIADNRSGELSTWNASVLTEQLKDMEESVQRAIGYDSKEIERMIADDAKKGFRPVEGGWLRTKEEYEQMAIKNLHLFYDADDYSFVTGKLDKLMELHEAEDHASALLAHLIEGEADEETDS